jgi:hypothetical protein
VDISDALDTEPENVKASVWQKLASGLSNPFILLALGTTIGGGVFSIGTTFLHMEWGEQSIQQTMSQRAVMRDGQIAALQAAIADNQQKIALDSQEAGQQYAAFSADIAAIKQSQADATFETTQVLTSISHIQDELDTLKRSIGGSGRPAIYFLHPNAEN